MAPPKKAPHYANAAFADPNASVPAWKQMHAEGYPLVRMVENKSRRPRECPHPRILESLDDVVAGIRAAPRDARSHYGLPVICCFGGRPRPARCREVAPGSMPTIHVRRAKG
jgi:hypothetical protein